MQLVERHVHQAREPTFNAKAGPRDETHQRSDRAVIPERDERAEVAVLPRFGRFAAKSSLDGTREMRGLLMCGLRARWYGPSVAMPWASCAVAERKNIWVERGLERGRHHELVKAMRLKASEATQDLRCLDPRRPHRKISRKYSALLRSDFARADFDYLFVAVDSDA